MLFYFYFKYTKTSDRLKPVIPQLLASEGKRALTCSRPTELYM